MIEKILNYLKSIFVKENKEKNYPISFRDSNVRNDTEARFILRENSAKFEKHYNMLRENNPKELLNYFKINEKIIDKHFKEYTNIEEERFSERFVTYISKKGILNTVEKESHYVLLNLLKKFIDKYEKEELANFIESSVKYDCRHVTLNIKLDFESNQGFDKTKYLLNSRNFLYDEIKNERNVIEFICETYENYVYAEDKYNIKSISNISCNFY